MLLLGLLLGGGLSWYSIQTTRGFGALKVGVWTAWPLAGDINSDPYTRAKVAAEGEVPLGAAEGIAFHANNDSAGNPLRRECTYRIAGQTPLARLWTAAAHDPSGQVLRKANGEPSAFVSWRVVRLDASKLEMTVGPLPTSSNWLEVTGNGIYKLVLRFYDTSITGSGGLLDAEMPALEQIACRS